MISLFNAEGLFQAGVDLVLLALCVWALADALIRPAPMFPATGKLTKPIWLAILVVSVLAAAYFGVFGLLGLAAAVASIVYLVDVRPAVRGRPDPWD